MVPEFTNVRMASAVEVLFHLVDFVFVSEIDQNLAILQHLITVLKILVSLVVVEINFIRSVVMSILTSGIHVRPSILNMILLVQLHLLKALSLSINDRFR